MRLILSVFITLSIFSSQSISAQLFNYEQIVSPAGFNLSQVVTEFEDKTYLIFTDINYNGYLYSYADGVLESIDSPAGYNLGSFQTTYNGKLYFSLTDNNFNRTLGSIENDIFSVHNSPAPTSDFGQFIFANDNTLYLQYFDVTSFEQVLKSFDGTDFEEISLPAGFRFDTYLGLLEGKHYFLLETNSYEIQLFSFENNQFTMLSAPPDLQFPFVQLVGSESIYFSAYDINFNQIAYELKDDLITELALPSGYENVVDGPVEWNGNLYFGLADTYFDNEVFSKRATDGTWTIYENPGSLVFQTIFDQGVLEDEMNLSYRDPANFNNSLVLFDGTENLQVIEGPPNADLTNFVSVYKGGKILSYVASNSYTSDLWYLKDGEVTIALVPDDHPDYSFLAARFSSSLYFAFQAGYYERAAYKLSLNARPESADSTVSTFAETPYKFNSSDFPFSDTDEEGEFGGIQIATIPAKGILHLNGAQVNVDDIITAVELSSLFYVPFDDGFGSPYDQFNFRVWDGFDVSGDDYIMYINVLSTSGINNNYLTDLKLFPNPATDFLNIDIGQPHLDQDINVSIIDNLGRVKASVKLNSRQQQLSLENYSDGNYFLLIHNEEHSSYRKFSIIR